MMRRSRTEAGRIGLEGCLCDDYFKIRELLYQQYAVNTQMSLSVAPLCPVPLHSPSRRTNRNPGCLHHHHHHHTTTQAPG
ncbi:hypothetical protein CRUP_022850 [Coryphaenoides rupestris]|nr:hypothetical protein CRUP_022850 [Coryphaenoides rupestris]